MREGPGKDDMPPEGGVSGGCCWVKMPAGVQVAVPRRAVNSIPPSTTRLTAHPESAQTNLATWISALFCKSDARPHMNKRVIKWHECALDVTTLPS